MSGSDRVKLQEEANQLVAEHGEASIDHLLSLISEAVGRGDDEAVSGLDAKLRLIEAKLAVELRVGRSHARS